MLLLRLQLLLRACREFLLHSARIAAITGRGVLLRGAVDGANPLVPEATAVVVIARTLIILPFITLGYLLVRARRLKALR